MLLLVVLLLVKLRVPSLACAAGCSAYCATCRWFPAPFYSCGRIPWRHHLDHTCLDRSSRPADGRACPREQSGSCSQIQRFLTDHVCLFDHPPQPCTACNAVVVGVTYYGGGSYKYSQAVSFKRTVIVLNVLCRCCDYQSVYSEPVYQSVCKSVSVSVSQCVSQSVCKSVSV